MIEQNEKLTNLEIIKVIKIRLVRGKGVKEDPVREVYQYWDMNGNLIKDDDIHSLEKNNNLNCELKRIGINFDKS